MPIRSVSARSRSAMARDIVERAQSRKPQEFAAALRRRAGLDA